MIYCDYNASAPLSDSLKGAFFDLPFANPSSQHQLGKAALKVVHDCERFLAEHFNVKDSHFSLFHSGATEGSNFFIRGVVRRALEANKKPYFLYLKTDHSCIVEQVPILKLMGVECIGVSTGRNMKFPLGEISKQVENILEDDSNEVILNYTWVHNESGVVWDLVEVSSLKAKFKDRMIVHVDATQSVAKIASYRELDESLDCYSYSGHKFGTLKGVGWSFLSKQYKAENPIGPLIVGGGQQSWLRSGTLNTHGIFSIQKALEQVVLDFKPNDQRENIEYLRAEFQSIIKNYAEVLPIESENLNLNTVFMYFLDIKSQLLIPAFDMAGMAVGSGSACSSGTFEESRLLQVLGLNNYAKNSLRISISPYITRDECEKLLEIFKKVVNQITAKDINL